MKDHSLMKELEKVQHYVNKIKEAEESTSHRTLELDKQAVCRIIAHDLSENSIPDMKKKRASIQDTDSSEIPLKKGVHIRFEPLSTESSTLMDRESLQTEMTETQNLEIITPMKTKHEKNEEASSFYVKTLEKIHKKHKNKHKKKNLNS
ncbi:hypothetical protein PCK2_000334 [Pneumocystis canis]|nr:hypothetical protein PCK2_000334 [Pneumocystis canis]